ncbi:membrane protein [Cellvibrio zantedeschiae]|uniref:Membrane protein n=1 Tax=Cellvibrio zantedeschiae TaxID=1237077 RepID=A0ABQ3ATM1_9GAMM|nr:lysylphosphatidylglycerol synthase domain-containing protein [Cellvibrio zantedeschiae]GGY67348.1 membrane protein [Cellvibrio zantedeschiae]
MSREKLWKWTKRVLTLFFFILVPIFLFMLIKHVDWHEVKEALQNLKPTSLLLGLLVALISYNVYGSYDVLGRKYAGHSLPIRQILCVAQVCYAFTLNLSYWVGGFALRFRLYSRLGLDTPTITKVFSLSVITNWLGYTLLAGIIFSLRLPDLPENWKIGETGLQLVGVVLLLIASTYLLACKFSRRRSWKFRKHEINLPAFTLALTQATLAAINWSLMALLVYILLPAKVDYLTVLSTLLISSLAGAIAHIPAGLGVLEAVFVAMLQHKLSHGSIIAALIGYRVIYFLIPLGVATITYLILESRAKKLRANNVAEKSSNNSSPSSSFGTQP